jgi:hypothetical protein
MSSTAPMVRASTFPWSRSGEYSRRAPQGEWGCRPATRAIVVALILTVLAGSLVGCTFTSVYKPHSGPAEIGVPVKDSFFTECGLHQTVFDLDGSLWVPVDVDPNEQRALDGVETPVDMGTLTLVAPDRAEYRSSSGRVFTLARREGDLTVREC